MYKEIKSHRKWQKQLIKIKERVELQNHCKINTINYRVQKNLSRQLNY